MDAVNFVKEYLRMCTKVDDCEDCPVYKTDFCTVPAKERSQESAEEIVELVEEWSAAHPRKTRQSVFLGNYPCARIDSQSVLYACPADVYGNNVCPKNKDDTPIICYDCRREFWMQEVE